MLSLFHMEQKYITEGMGEHEAWYSMAAKMSSKDELAQFIHHLMASYSHDMNTVAHALAAGALATISVMNSYPEGQISPSQAHKLLGLFVRKYAKMQGPITVKQWLGLLNMGNRKSFTTIPRSVWAEVQANAVMLISEDDAHRAKDTSSMTPQEKEQHQKNCLGEAQREHILAIKNGIPPWGLTVE